jgi:hypothetical protein
LEAAVNTFLDAIRSPKGEDAAALEIRLEVGATGRESLDMLLSQLEKQFNDFSAGSSS